MRTHGLTALFLAWAAELDKYVFQDSQFDSLSKDLFSKSGALGSACISFLIPWGALYYQTAALRGVVRSLPNTGTGGLTLGIR